MKIKTVITVIALTALCATAMLSGCGGDKTEDIEDINEVKALSYYSSGYGSSSIPIGGAETNGELTYGEFIENYCPGGKWKQFSDGSDFVNYIGGDSSEGYVSIQWEKYSSGWEVRAMEVEGAPISTNRTKAFFSGEAWSPDIVFLGSDAPTIDR
jgi:hypothetical protein